MIQDTNNPLPQPTFSVIIPTHNRAHLLPRAVNSVLAQTFADFELIIVDDASTDETAEVVADFDDPRIVYLRREQNSGVSATRNAGIKLAKGKRISFLDDDDEYLPIFLEETHHAFESVSDNVGFMWCGIYRVREVDSGLETVSEILWNPIFNSREEAFLSFFSNRHFGTGYGFTVDASCFQEVGMFDETMRAAEDTDFLLRIAQVKDYCVISKFLVRVYEHDSAGLRRASPARGYALAKIIEKHATILRKHGNAWAKMHLHTARVFYHAGNKREARTFIMRAAQKKPLDSMLWRVLLANELLGTPTSLLRRRLAAARDTLLGKVPRTHTL